MKDLDRLKGDYDFKKRYRVKGSDYEVIRYTSENIHNIRVNSELLPNKVCYTTRDAYMLYHVADKPKKSISKLNYMLIIEVFVETIFDLLVDGFKINMPNKMGSIGVKSKQINLNPNSNGEIIGAVNWKKTNALWEKYPEEKLKKTRIYYLNEHSDNKSYRVSWFKKFRFVNFNFYNLKLSEAFKDKFANLIKAGWSNENTRR